MVFQLMLYTNLHVIGTHAYFYAQYAGVLKKCSKYIDVQIMFPR